MSYISWAMYCEGVTDREYLRILIPRVIEDIVLNSAGGMATVPENPVEVFGVRVRSFEEAAQLICDAKKAFHLLFVHSDTGGRALEEQLSQRTISFRNILEAKCDFRQEFCVFVCPRHETEAWCLADQNAIRLAFGLSTGFAFPELDSNPSKIELLPDPKSVATALVKRVSFGRRSARGSFPFVAVAQRQNLEVLRQLPSFQDFEAMLRSAMAFLGHR